MEYVVDRIEGEHIVLEIDIGKTINFPLELIPSAKEGDTIKIEIVDSSSKVEKIEKLINKVFED